MLCVTLRLLYTQVGAFASHVDGFKKGGASDLIKAYHKKYADAIKSSTKKPADAGTVADSAMSAAAAAISAEDPASNAAETTEEPLNESTVDPAVASFSPTPAEAISMPLPCELERMRLEDRLEIVFVQALSALVTAFCARLVVPRLNWPFMILFITVVCLSRQIHILFFLLPLSLPFFIFSSPVLSTWVLRC